MENDGIINILKNLSKSKKSNNIEKKLSTSFRQVSKEQHIPLESAYYDPVPVELPDNTRKHSQRGHLILVNADTNNVPSRREEYDMSRTNVPQLEAGVYTEGGLVYVPEGDDKKDRKSSYLLFVSKF